LNAKNAHFRKETHAFVQNRNNAVIRMRTPPLKCAALGLEIQKDAKKSFSAPLPEYSGKFNAIFLSCQGTFAFVIFL
jgi:hypothetical protein